MAETNPQNAPAAEVQPDLPGLDSPGAAAAAPAPSAPSQMESVAQPNLTQANQPAYGEPGAAQEPSTVVSPKPGTNMPAPNPQAPHARLLSMVQGLSLGLEAFGKSIATQGKEGGVGEVTQVLGEQKRQQQEAVAAAQAQKNAQLQNQIGTANLNILQGQVQKLHATLPDEIAQSHLNVQKTQSEVAGAQQQQDIEGANFVATHGGMDAATFKKEMSNPAPVGDEKAGVNPYFMNTAQSTLRAALQSKIPADNPVVQNMQSTLANPKATARDVYTATQQLQAEQDRFSKATDEAVKQETMQKDELAQGQARIADAAWRKQAPKDAQGNPTQDFETWQKTQQKTLDQAVTQGSPELAGAQLASGVATLAELKSRGATPDFIQKTIAAAQKVDPNYNASDEIVGEQVLKNTANQTFFGSARSLVQAGGMLDQLKAAHDRLGNGQIPQFNKYADWVAYHAGTPELAAYKASVLGAADDYAKVVGGGNPTDSARQASADQFLYDLNNGQFDTTVETSRGAIRSQVEGRIGTNRYVAQREGDILTQASGPVAAASHPAPPQSPASKMHKNMGDFAHQFAGKNGTIFSDDGKTWYDTHGVLVK